MQDKKGRILILGGFYIILSLEVGRRPAALPVSNGLRPEEISVQLMHTQMLILRYPKSMGRKFPL
jgi:hypothetical protein